MWKWKNVTEAKKKKENIAQTQQMEIATAVIHWFVKSHFEFELAL